MILPIVGYGHPVLKVGENISQEHPELKETI
jgi:peptide deformylase